MITPVGRHEESRFGLTAVPAVKEERQIAGTENRDAKVPTAVLGTGIMGSAMTRNVIAAGLLTTVWERSGAATTPLSEAGAVVAASPVDAVKDALAVITMLPAADVVNSVIFDGGVAAAFAEGAVWAQMGTIGVTETTQVAGRLGRSGPT